MDNKFKLWFCLAVALQILIIAAIFAFNQFGSFLGENVLLKLTAPKDPLSLFQGHYLILDYEISSLDTSSLSSDNFERGNKVFVGLEKKGDFWQAVSVSKTKPKNENVYMEGEAVFMGWMPEGDHSIRINYGIEKYFIPEKDWQRTEDIIRKATIQGTAFVQVNISPFNHKGSVKKIFINGEEFKVDKLLNKTSSGQSYGPELKAKDTRIMAGLSQSRTVMIYTYSDDNNYDNFSCQQSDQINICRDVSNTGGAITIAKNPAINSNSACAFSPMNNPDTPWYCVDSTGRAGFTVVDPGRTGYCLNGKSAVCPPLVDERVVSESAPAPSQPVPAPVIEKKSVVRSIKVMFPNGGEPFCLGESIVIQWQSQGVKTVGVRVIQTSPYSVGVFSLVKSILADSADSGVAGDGIFPWEVGDWLSGPGKMEEGGNYKVEVYSNDGESNVSDTSDQSFNITNCQG